MCLAWFKGQLNSKTYFAHAGGGGGYYCEIRIYPDAGLGSVIMFNRTGMNDERVLDKIDKYFIETKIDYQDEQSQNDNPAINRKNIQSFHQLKHETHSKHTSIRNLFAIHGIVSSFYSRSGASIGGITH
jgi:hypothetical protein